MNMQNKELRLPVSEVFYSIQGEGQTMGVPAVFLRLGGCNILCQSKHWVCDTIEVWRKSKSTAFDEILSEEFTKRIIEDGAHLIITGEIGRAS
ncbi:MAG: Cellulophaga phage phiSM, partial [Bacteroidota bacterium]